ncbi:NAD-P-binding protein [Panus rudis PR-1116 ss-1]|nr:NAD-P-binding protein [Panus rudis PR-1116 ss-1]
MTTLILSAQDVQSVTSKFSPDDLVTLMARVFRQFSSNDSAEDSAICLPHRLTVPMKHHTALFMPSRISQFGTAIKVVSVPTPDAPAEVRAKGLPGSTLVLDEETGAVKALVNASNLTALRNAAGSLLSTRILLSTSTPPQTILAVGAGAQVAAHLSIFLAYYASSVKDVLIFNRSVNERVLSLVSELQAKFPNVSVRGLKLPAINSGGEGAFKEAVSKADIIVTATSSTEPLFPSEWVKSGTHLCLIGSYKPSMHEVDTALIKRAGIVVVDSRDACKIEAGEIIAASLPDDRLIEIGELIDVASPVPVPVPVPVPSGVTNTEETNLAKTVPVPVPVWTPRKAIVDQVHAAGDVTIFKSVGVGIQDVAIAHAVVELAKSSGVGTEVPL